MRHPRSSVLGVVLAVALSASAGGIRAEGVSVSCQREEVRCGDDLGAGAIHLSRRLIIASSDTVLTGARMLVRGTDYRMDYARGIVLIPDSLTLEECVRIKYSVFPFPLKTDYSLRVIDEAPGPGLGARRAEIRPAKKEKGYDLRASGSKTVSVETGTLNDFSMNQSLNLSIGGKIGEGVDVKGVLTDKDMSLSRSTSTSKLRDLDRVFMEVRSSGAYARVGDLEIDESPGELLRFRRSMTGFFADASHGSKGVALSGATSRSAYESVVIRGREGITGPYVVQRADGEKTDIVRGSESVWLDGKPLKRGDNADYTIDYVSGEICFNPRHLVRDGARIVVDYESPDRDGNRQFYFGRSSLDIGDRASVAVNFVSETGANQPEEQAGAGAELLASGTDGAREWVDGGRFAGMGRGSYIRIESDTVAYYEYVGEGLGDYDVTFTLVGEGEGTYSYIYSEIWAVYVYVYTGTGAYLDKVRAGRPLGARVFHVGASARPAEWLELTSEVAQSKGHTKTEAGTWEEEEGRAYTVAVQGRSDLPDLGGRSVGSLGLSAKKRSVGKTYIGFDRLRRPDFLEVWAQDAEDGFEDANEIGLDYKLNDMVASSFEIGTMETSSGRSLRRKAGLELGDRRLGLTASSQTARMSSVASEKGIDRNGIAVRIPVKFLQLTLGRNHETKSKLVDSTSTRRTDYSSQVELSGTGGQVSLAFSAGSEDRDRGAGWDKYSSEVEGRLEFETARQRRLLIRGGVTQRRIEYTRETAAGGQRITSGDFHFDLRDVLAVSSMSIDYRLSNALTTVYDAELVQVSGGGDYDSLGNYVPGAGGYVMSRSEKGKEPVTRVKADLVLELGRRGKVLLDRAVSARTGIDIEGESSTQELERIAFLYPAHLLRSDEMVFGRMTVSEELVFRRGKGLTLTLNAKGSRFRDNRCIERKESKTTTELQTRLLSSAFKKMRVTLAGRLTATRSTIDMTSGSVEPTRDTWSTNLSLDRNIVSAVRSQVRLELLNEERSEPTSAFMQVNASPGITVFSGALRCDAGCSLRRVIRSEYSSATLYPVRDSFTWNSRVNLRHGRYTSVSFEYTGRKTSGIPTIHNVKASLSATF
ncbi:MAG: hypothetical protein ABIJ00_06355 [Candidatus Eisenbacteria bacterium]